MAYRMVFVRNLVNSAIIVLAGVLLAGCGSQSTSSASHAATGSPSATAEKSHVAAAGAPTATASPRISARPSQTGEKAGSVASSPAATAVAAACTTANLRISLGNGGATAGTYFTLLDFTNGGSVTCTIYGFPGVSLADSSGTQIGAAATRNPSVTATLVTLTPGAKATARLGVVNAGNYPASACRPATAARLRVFPPNQTESVSVPFSITGCAASGAKQLSVTAVAAS
jgi:hypothetical protein